MRIFSLFLALSLAPIAAAAVATHTNTVTVTPTVTPGEGSYMVTTNPVQLVRGDSHNTMQIDFQAGVSDWDHQGGLLHFYFPIAFTEPSASNFFVQPSQSNQVVGYGFNGRAVDVHVRDLPSASTLTFLFGYAPGGFHVGTTATAVNLIVRAYPQSVTLGAGGFLVAQPLIPIVTATISPTISPTFTRTTDLTRTQSPTMTISVTQSMTWTQSPIPAIEPDEVFSYPNPFDLRRFSKVTFRFPVFDGAKVTVFNLLGEPIREIANAQIDGAQGWAVWDGRDDLNRRVSGGLYYVRVKGKTLLVRKFTVLN